MSKVVLDIWKLRQLLDSTDEKHIGMFISAVGMAYHQKQINYSSVLCLLHAMEDKFDVNH